MSYLPAANESHLRCRTVPIRLVAKDGRAIESHNLFDSYGKLPWSKEKQHLDLFGRRLKAVIGARGYIVVHGKHGTRGREAAAHASRALTYLRRHYQLSDGLIEIVEGDRLRQFTLELYFIPRTEQKPD